MHELSLCRSISEIVVRAASGRRVVTIGLDIGELRQVVPRTLDYCWGIASAGGPLEGSRLQVTRVPVDLGCSECGAVTRWNGRWPMACALCWGRTVRVRRGEEFVVTAIDVEG